MPQSESITKLTKALASAQAEFGIIPKTKKGQEGNRSFFYADLADVLNEIRPKLNKQGIFLSHPLVLEPDGQHVRVTTRVDLEDEFMQSDGIRLSSTEGAGKGLGVENTYARRIDNNNFFGIFPDEDLDAPDLKPTGDQKIPQKSSVPYTTKTAPKPPAPTPKTVVVNMPPPGEPVVTNGTFVATEADLPPQMSDEDPAPKEPTLAPEDAELADSLGKPPEFVALTQDRNNEIQGTLREWVKSKTIPARSVSAYLDKVHQGKKQFDVSATQWEDTFKKISDAVAAGPEAVKTFFKENK